MRNSQGSLLLFANMLNRLAGTSFKLFKAPLVAEAVKVHPTASSVAAQSFRHMATSNPAVAVGSPIMKRPDFGPTEKMNMFTAINNAMHIALATDPK